MEVIVADITQLDVDAVVNAANEGLLGGGGVDGAIHRAAGPELRLACARVPESSPGVRCPTGEARITPGFRLRARHVIHTAGPIWQGGAVGEADLLASCYRESLVLASAHDVASIAFPAISCGIYGYPADEAAAVAVQTTRSVLRSLPQPMRVLFCCFDAQLARTYQAQLAAVN